MEENQIQTETMFNDSFEPANADNSGVSENHYAESAVQQVQPEGQSVQDPSEDLILGKFKSVEDLSKAYEELQRHQGLCSEELGWLRKNVSSMNQLKQSFETLYEMQNGFLQNIKRDQEKYNSPEYFQDPTFREIYKEALESLGDNLDTDKFVNLLEAYVSSRIFANNRKQSAQNETQQILDSMTYDKNNKSSFTPPSKRLDEMTDKEVDELLDRLI